MGYLLNLLFALVTWFVICFGGPVVGMSDNFYFIQHPKFPDKVVEGQRLIIPCQVSETDHIVYHWLLNNRLVENTTRRYLNTSSLVIEPVHRGRDTGQYQCVAQNTSSGYSTASSVADLTIGWIGAGAKVTIISPTNTQTIHEGNSLVLQCVVEGSGFQVKWYRNSVEVSLDDRITVDDLERTLKMSALSVHDNGVYSCEVANEAVSTVSQKNFPLVISRPDIANIRLLPQDLTVNKGSPAQFDCVYQNARKVEWFNRDQETPMKNASKWHTIFPNGTLYFPKVRPGDVGSYRCVGVMHDGELEEVSERLGYIAELKIVVRPELSRTSLFPIPNKDNKYILRAGSTLEVFCRVRAEAHPSPNVTWVNSMKEQVSNSSFWLIEGVQPSHAGDYTCRAQNGFGTAEEYTINLVVTILPIISQEPETSITVDEEAPFQIFCAYKGSPGPLTTITWMRSPPRSSQHDNIVSTPSHQIINRDSSSQLLVQRAVAADDSGNYRCQVTTLGFDPVYSESAAVLIRERLKFTSKPLNQHLELASKAKIHCRAHATEAVRIRWNKRVEGGKTILPNHLRADRSGTLWFDGVRKEDEGVYICTAETKDEIINATARVEVVISPKFTVKPVDLVAFTGHVVVIDCQAIGDPLPAIHWDKEGRPNSTESGRWILAENGSLIIENVRPGDGGHYGCTAGNKGGFKREEIELTVQQENSSSVTQTVVIILSCSSGYFILVIALVVYCKRKRSRKSEPESNPLTVFTPEHIIQTSYPTPESTLLLSKNPRNPPSLASFDQPSSIGKHARSHNSHLYETAHLAPTSDDCRNSPCNTSSAYSSAVLSDSKHGAYISRKQLCNLQKIGRGQFGEVLTAVLANESSPSCIVVIKTRTLHQSRDHEDVTSEFTAEYEMYRKLKHPNVVRCLGLCQPTRTLSEWAIYEHTKAGNLKSFLLANTEYVTHQHLLSFALQIAQGMQYISANRHVHRDLAARNCVVDVLPNNDLVVKVGNLSLSRESTHEQDYYLYRNSNLPVRWMPAEAVFEDEYSTKSDVWSFGVVCYELFTLCLVLPYAELSDEQVLQVLEQDKLSLVDDKDDIGEEEQRLIERCMVGNPTHRPTFDEILSSWELMDEEGDG